MGLVSSYLDAAPKLEPGTGRLDLGAFAYPGFVGAGARFDYRLVDNMNAYAAAEAGYDWVGADWLWRAHMGLRIEL
jgi:hypothetical protein